ncbi:MAG: hypothetical protein M1376_07285 [Planctomycetes bacterium]|nr:hypothetical protein [Planctomycetota bacterium]
MRILQGEPKGSTMACLYWDDLLEDAKMAGAQTQERMTWNSDHWHGWLDRQGCNALVRAFNHIDRTYRREGLTRADVLQYAKQVRQARRERGDAAMRFMVAVMLWGYADSDGRGPWRVIQMTTGDDCQRRVIAILDALEGQGPHAAYRLICNRRHAGLPWLGASYGTKVLYFGGYEATACAELRPIILDEFVARAFNHLEQVGPHFHPGWCWRNYVLLLERVRERAALAGVREDDIEYRLFEAGRNLPAG